MEQNRPRSREKNVTGTGNVSKRGSGLGTGSVGNGGGYFNQHSDGGSGNRGPGGSKLISIIAVIAVLLLGGGSGLGGLLQGFVGNTDSGNIGYESGYTGNTGTGTSSTGKLNTAVADGTRAKRTTILGDGKDTVTIMIYMCGTDLESRSGMATADLQEMMNATIGSNVNLLVYTGGCKAWKNSTVSSSRNQIYQVVSGGIKCLESDMGNPSMTKPETLTSFINWCTKNYPANRQMLIFWDHGGGSLSGYGYDEKNAGSGSMNLAGINKALKASNTTFDFIGFDACLMATLETGLMLTPYGDYMIASEETEPGVGWYYTNWLTNLSQNTSMSTLEIGKNIIDDFVDVCAKKCAGQKTTLSIVDLAELETTVPDKFAKFASSTGDLISKDEYKTVSQARYQTREFAQSSAIDQVDLTHLALNLNTAEGNELAKALQNTVKYNRTSSNMSNAYGISIYFPYKKTSKVDQAVATYDAIGLDDEYSRCIQSFAKLEVSGQAAAGGTSSAVTSLLGGFTGGGTNSSDAISQILNSFLNDSSIAGLNSSNLGFFTGKAISNDYASDYVSKNQFDSGNLLWKTDNGTHKIEMPKEQWDLVQNILLNQFYDDGSGYIDLGLDNVFEFDADGRLIGDTDKSWLAINGQPVAYYYLDTVENGSSYTITGYVPAMLNGERVQLILVFTDQTPYGTIAGARKVYTNGETETTAKETTGLAEGDKLDFLCDYYDYNGNYQDSYYLGEQMIVTSDMQISNVVIEGGRLLTAYRFTDIYNQNYWTPILQ